MFGRRHDCNRLLFLDVLNRVKDRVNRNIGFRGVSSALELRDFVLFKQGGHKGVDNWPWPGGHSTLSSPTLFMVDY
jgi:hypothetical protein